MDNIYVDRLNSDLGYVEKIYITGAFGFHLKLETLRNIGLLPAGLDAPIEFVGNTAKEGAKLCPLSKNALDETIKLQKDLIPLELSYAADFQDNFIEQLNFLLI